MAQPESSQPGHLASATGSQGTGGSSNPPKRHKAGRARGWQDLEEAEVQRLSKAHELFAPDCWQMLELLQAMRFSVAQALQVVFRPRSSSTTSTGMTARPAEMLVRNGAKLLSVYGHEDLMRIADKECGGQNLLAVALLIDWFELHRFTAADVLAMAAHEGGFSNVFAARLCAPALEAAGYSRADVARMAAHRSGRGAAAVTAVNDSLAELEVLGMAPQQVNALLAGHGGLHSLLAAKTLGVGQLVRALGFTPAQVAQLGPNSMGAVQRSVGALKAMELGAGQVVRIATQGGLEGILSVRRHLPTLQGLRFAAEDVVELVGRAGGWEDLVAVACCSSALQLLEFAPEHVIQTARHAAGLAAVHNSADALHGLGMTGARIMVTMRRRGGQFAAGVAAVRRSAAALQALAFAPGQVVELASLPGPVHLAYVREELASLQASGATPEEVVRAAVLKDRGKGKGTGAEGGATTQAGTGPGTL